MPDIYASILEAPAESLSNIARVLEIRAADPQQAAMRADYLSTIDLSAGSLVVEVGCGTGAVARTLAETFPTCRVLGIDPSPFFIGRAAQLGQGLPNLRFTEGDARQLPLAEESVDALVFHTTLCHVPELDAALAEASRVLRPRGTLAVFDADYASTSVANQPNDPLQSCIAACVEAIVHDPFLARKLAPSVNRAGFKVRSFRTHSYHGVSDAAYLLTVVDRGADALAFTGIIGRELADALKAEARRRVDQGTFYGQLTYASLIAVR
jgi:ubiquinone/menaquinone biosynthesis C-methylase UbiE